MKDNKDKAFANALSNHSSTQRQYQFCYWQNTAAIIRKDEKFYNQSGHLADTSICILCFIANLIPCTLDKNKNIITSLL